MTPQLLLSPPVVLLLFVALVFGLYRLGPRLSPTGEDHPGKHRPYACGEDLVPATTRLKYEAFFPLALAFALLHLATLVIATLPPRADARYLATGYFLAIGFSVFVLTRGEA